MANRASLLWSDDSCLEEHEYRCYKNEDLEQLIELSIDRSICFLEKNVYAIQEENHRYGFKTEKFLQSKHKLCTTERFLHKVVSHWRDSGLVNVRWNAFSETVKLPPLVMQNIKSFLMRTRSQSL